MYSNIAKVEGYINQNGEKETAYFLARGKYCYSGVDKTNKTIKKHQKELNDEDFKINFFLCEEGVINVEKVLKALCDGPNKEKYRRFTNDTVLWHITEETYNEIIEEAAKYETKNCFDIDFYNWRHLTNKKVSSKIDPNILDCYHGQQLMIA